MTPHIFEGLFENIRGFIRCVDSWQQARDHDRVITFLSHLVGCSPPACLGLLPVMTKYKVDIYCKVPSSFDLLTGGSLATSNSKANMERSKR